MSLKRAVYKDDRGMFRVVMLPDNVSEDEAPHGIPLGPPNLSELGLPEEMEVRLSNELYYRDILTPVDAVKNRAGIASAIQSVLKLDADRIVTLYAGKDYQNARKESPENQSNSTVSSRRPR